jgi:hypothetical protein
VTDDPRCWYCGAEAVLWCDHMVGREYAHEQLQLRIDQTDWSATLSGPFMTDRDLGRMHMDLRTLQPIATCDAAACASCAARHGWERLGHICGPTCAKGGCATLENCHVHRGQGLGTSLYVARGAAEETRREVRALCRRAAMGVV